MITTDYWTACARPAETSIFHPNRLILWPRSTLGHHRGNRQRTIALHQLQRSLARRLPFFYGWVVLACAACAGFARQGPAVATLTVFMVPMTSEFGWSMTEMSGAVALGGIMAAISSPMLGPLVDRHGARAMLCSAVLITGVAALLLSQTSSLLMFYLFFCVARMNFAGPFDLGIYGAVNSWFINHRPIVTAVASF